MKKKLGRYLIYFIYIFELIYTMSAMYFNNSIVTHKIEIFENIYQIAYCMIFIVGILYILLLIYKVGHHESIDLKKNTGLLFGIVFMDLVLYGFFIIPMLVSSPAMKMVCICFLIHLLISEYNCTFAQFFLYVCITYADSIIPNKIDIAKKISDL